MRTVLLLFSMAAAIVIGVTGCSDQLDQLTGNSSPQKQNVAQKPDKVVVNEGLSKEEEEELNQRLEELEKKVEAEDKAGSRETANQPEESSQPEQSEQQAEDDVRAAAESYYQAVSRADWSYTYDNLDSETQSVYTEDEWVAKNQWFADNGSVSFDILSVDLDNSNAEPIADVSVGLDYGDGTSSTRLTYFVYENGSWKHRFGEEENNLYMPNASYDEFVAAQGGASSASSQASASASSSASANPSGDAAGLKHVKVVISSDVPVDVSISDDSLDWLIFEEITGTKIYERDIASNSGLSVDAANSNFRGNVSIEVYENGELKTQDSDSSGFAQVVY